MLFLKCSFLLLLLTTNAYAQKFTSKECLEAKFTTNIKHEGKFFGLIKNSLIIKKESCLFEIAFKNILETKWKIDICREPIHIKVKKMGSESFYKREGTCLHGLKNDFCEHWNALKENLQDYGLIFAKGERERMTTSHGQTHCTYLLLQRYLDDGVLFSKFEEPKSIFSKEEVTKSTALTISPPSNQKLETIAVEEPQSEKIDLHPVVEEQVEEKPRF